ICTFCTHFVSGSFLNEQTRLPHLSTLPSLTCLWFIRNDVLRWIKSSSEKSTYHGPIVSHPPYEQGFWSGRASIRSSFYGL
ncbi:hypothetical protein WG66_008068, partial [Moniliophthora roreri]